MKLNLEDTMHNEFDSRKLDRQVTMSSCYSLDKVTNSMQSIALMIPLTQPR